MSFHRFHTLYAELGLVGRVALLQTGAASSKFYGTKQKKAGSGSVCTPSPNQALRRHNGFILDQCFPRLRGSN